MRIRKQRFWWLLIGAVVLLLVAAVATSVLWYNGQLQPVDPSDDQTLRVDIKQGMSASAVAETLEGRGAIRSALAMNIYLRLHGGSGAFRISE
jgi:cell division protein YceG involved in septum cleavage